MQHKKLNEKNSQENLVLDEELPDLAIEEPPIDVVDPAHDEELPDPALKTPIDLALDEEPTDPTLDEADEKALIKESKCAHILDGIQATEAQVQALTIKKNNLEKELDSFTQEHASVFKINQKNAQATPTKDHFGVLYYKAYAEMLSIEYKQKQIQLIKIKEDLELAKCELKFFLILQNNQSQKPTAIVAPLIEITTQSNYAQKKKEHPSSHFQPKKPRLETLGSEQNLFSLWKDPLMTSSEFNPTPLEGLKRKRNN